MHLKVNKKCDLYPLKVLHVVSADQLHWQLLVHVERKE